MVNNDPRLTPCVELGAFRGDPRSALRAADDGALAVMEGGAPLGAPLFYCLSPDVFDAILDRMETLEAMVAIGQRHSERETAVPWNTL